MSICLGEGVHPSRKLSIAECVDAVRRGPGQLSREECARFLLKFTNSLDECRSLWCAFKSGWVNLHGANQDIEY